MTYLQSILARVLSLADPILAVWTTTPTVIPGDCGSGVLNVCVNDCGESLVRLLVDHRWLEVIHDVVEALAYSAGSY